jgi:titin
LTGLTPATSYTIVVTPSNAVGAGVSASITALTISSTVPGTPTGVTATAGFSTTYGDTATVAWTAPALTGGAPITSYTVKATNTTTGAVVTCTITGAGSALCPALVAGNSYAVTVTANNVVGASVASTPAVVAAFGNPPAVTGVTAVRNANGLQVSWTATATVFGATNSAVAVPVLGYIVNATDQLTGAQFACGVNATYGVVLAPAVTCNIGGLTVGSNYTVSVKAANLLSGLSPAATVTALYNSLTPEPIIATFSKVTATQKSVSALSPVTKTALSGLISSINDGASITITGYGTTKAIAQARANAAASYLFNNGAAVHITIKTVISKTVATALVTVTSN